MSAYNTTRCALVCPRCGVGGEHEVFLYFGDVSGISEVPLGSQYPFWEGRRPEAGGALQPEQPWGEGWAECRFCSRDFYCKARIVDGVLATVEVNQEALPLVPDETRSVACPMCHQQADLQLVWGYSVGRIICSCGGNESRFLDVVVNEQGEVSAPTMVRSTSTVKNEWGAYYLDK